MEERAKDMSVMYLLITLSLLLAASFLVAFIFAIRSGQYDDKYTPSVRILFDDEIVNDEDKKPNKKPKQNT